MSDPADRFADVTRTKVLYACAICGHEASQWAGRCSACGEWGSVAESSVRASSGSGGGVGPLDDGLEVESRVTTGVPGLDRVLGGGLVPGSVVLLAGAPGHREVHAPPAPAGEPRGKRRRLPAGVGGGVTRAGRSSRPAPRGRCGADPVRARSRARSAPIRHAGRAAVRARGGLHPDPPRPLGSPDGRRGRSGPDVCGRPPRSRQGARASRSSWRATSRRTVTWPGHGRSSTRSTSCCPSRVTSGPASGCSQEARTGSAPRARRPGSR